MSALILFPLPHFRELPESNLLSGELTSEDEGRKRVLCLSCSLSLTMLSNRYYYGGQNCFTFKNPAGMVFEIMLFFKVENVFPVGEAESYFSWFEGCQWQVLICSRCRSHLGWLFSGKEHFYALIRSKIYIENGR